MKVQMVERKTRKKGTSVELRALSRFMAINNAQLDFHSFSLSLSLPQSVIIDKVLSRFRGLREGGVRSLNASFKSFIGFAAHNRAKWAVNRSVTKPSTVYEWMFRRNMKCIV